MPRILVIEDEDEFRENILEILHDKNFVVAGASTGSIGLQLAREFQPELIICDVNMPDLDGYGVLSVLRQDPALQVIPFIFLTGLDGMQQLRQGMQLGADDYLCKPMSKTELLAAIDTRLQKQDSVKTHYTNRSAALPSPQPGPLLTDKLTPRQREILKLVATGKTTKEIAQALFISTKTVETHRSQLMERLKIHDLASLIRYAIKAGLVDLESE